jgi:hypothetical protein
VKRKLLIIFAVILLLILVFLGLFSYFKLNSAPCSPFLTPAQKESCYLDFALNNLDESACDKIKSPEKSLTCHESVQALLGPEIKIKSVKLRTSGIKDEVQELEYEEGKEYYIQDSNIDGEVIVILEAVNKNLEDITFNADCDIIVGDKEGQASICSYLEACQDNGFPSWTNMNLNATISKDMQKIISLPKGKTAQFNLYISPNLIKPAIEDKFKVKFNQEYIHVVNCNIQFASETQKIGKTVFIQNYFVKA